jgi:hypothetical protein
MGLDFALDELYATGWTNLDTQGGSVQHTDGRAHPSLERVRQEFAAAGCTFTLRRIDRFNCYRAEWTKPDGRGTESVVGHSEAEAAVYALAQLRRQLVAVGV